MEDKYILKKDFLVAFLRKLRKHHRLVAPVTNRHGDTLFQPIDSLDHGTIDLTRHAQNSVKHFLFPQQETLFTYSTADNGYSFVPVRKPPEPTVYFGVRSCDLSAILYLDVVFLGGTKDHQYLEKRQNALLIGINCNQPFANCFCNAMNSGPFLEYGFDLQFTDLGDRFLVQTGRVAGERLVNEWREFFQAAEPQDVQARYQAYLEARGLFRLHVHADQAIKRLAEENVPEWVWHHLSLRCQDCGGCAYTCPTCTCFTINDKPDSPHGGERVRSWDACTFAGFTKMAGGHNPVDQKKQAVRQRFMHKLRYDVEEHGRPSCVGCGRCVDMCFGGTDMVKFIHLACVGPDDRRRAAADD